MLTDKQRKIEAELSALESIRDDITKKIREKRKTLTEFIELNGNAILKEERDREWAAKQVEFEKVRKTPEWQAWRQEFLKSNETNHDGSWVEPANSWTFVHEDVSKEDIELFLGPDSEKDTNIIQFSDNFTMTDIALTVGKFPSRGQARKNGWEGPIPKGFTQTGIGKNEKRVHIWILNKVEE